MILTPGFVDRELSSTMGVEPIESIRLCPFISASSVWDEVHHKLNASIRVKWVGGVTAIYPHRIKIVLPHHNFMGIRVSIGSHFRDF
jgi:hypothetical protein